MKNISSKAKIIFPTVLGSVVEYYDFGIYAVFAPTIGRVFFPQNSEFVQLLLTFIIFAIGFLMRPIGGIIFGHIGDKYGRKIALNISVIGMAFATFGIGILPGYNIIGIAAPIILLLIRMIQGVCIGGEGTGSAIFMLEHFAKNRLGFIGSLVMGCNMFGTLLALYVGMFISNVYGLNDFNWRYGFIFGTFMGLICIYTRRKIEETPIFHAMKESNKIIKSPFAKVVKEKGMALILVIFLSGAVNSIAYLVRGYLNTFFFETLHYPIEQALHFTSFCLLLLIVLLPIFGYIAEIIGQSKFLRFMFVIVVLCILPTFRMLANAQHNISEIYIALAFLSVLGASIAAPAYPYVIKSFPPELRYSGVALGWNIGNALMGGTTPFIATILVEKVSRVAPAYYLIFTSMLFLIISQLLRRYSYEGMREKISEQRNWKDRIKDKK